MSKSSASGKSDSVDHFEEKALSDINEAYNHFLTINVLDISKEGHDIFDATKRLLYNTGKSSLPMYI